MSNRRDDSNRGEEGGESRVQGGFNGRSYFRGRQLPTLPIGSRSRFLSNLPVPPANRGGMADRARARRGRGRGRGGTQLSRKDADLQTPEVSTAETQVDDGRGNPECSICPNLLRKLAERDEKIAKLEAENRALKMKSGETKTNVPDERRAAEAALRVGAFARAASLDENVVGINREHAITAAMNQLSLASAARVAEVGREARQREVDAAAETTRAVDTTARQRYADSEASREEVAARSSTPNSYYALRAAIEYVEIRNAAKEILRMEGNELNVVEARLRAAEIAARVRELEGDNWRRSAALRVENREEVGHDDGEGSQEGR